MNKKLLLLLVSIFLNLISVTAAFAGDAEVYTGLFNKNAVGGYDTVAYFTEHKAIKGSSEFVTTWKGATWQFSSVENLNKFKNNPEKYAPQYGGYCAYAVALNKTASADPQAWKIINEKLYLNYDKDVKMKWEANAVKYINDADKHWPKVIK